MNKNMKDAIADVKALVELEKWQEILETISDYPPNFQTHKYFCTTAYKAALQVKNDAAAEPFLDMILLLIEDNSSYLRDKGRFLCSRKEFVAAQPYFEKAIALKPELASYHASLGASYYDNHQFAEAIPHYLAALERDGNQKSWWNRLGRCYNITQDTAKTLETYQFIFDKFQDPATEIILSELKRQNEGQNSSASSSYYDDVYSSSEKYNASALESSYRPVWEQILAQLADKSSTKILDLGCGPGQFAEFLHHYKPNISYCGVDFSKVAIEKSKERCPNFHFAVKTLPLQSFEDLPAFNTIVCTEVLEHVENDVEILDAVPAGIKIIASVPNFDTFSHLRFFTTKAEVRDRYAFLFENLAVQPFALGKDNIIWLMVGTRSRKRK